MTLIETRVSEIEPGDEWFFDGAWVTVVSNTVRHPDDRVDLYYQQDDEGAMTRPRGNEVAVVKR